MKKTLFSAAILALLGFTAFSSTGHMANASNLNVNDYALADTDTSKTPDTTKVPTDTAKHATVALAGIADTTTKPLPTDTTKAPSDTTKKVVLY